jgi:ATP-dependent DNA ligase
MNEFIPFGLPKPMKAVPLHPKVFTTRRNTTVEYLTQPKFRGVRCQAVVFDNFIRLYSSLHHELPHLPHLLEELRFLPYGIYDGELYNSSLNQQEINSIALRKINRHPDYTQVYFHIYDLVPLPNTPLANFTAIQRWRALESRFAWPDLWKKTPHVKLVPTQLSSDYFDFLEKTQEYLEAGYEGGIVRISTALYSPGKTTAMYKYKPSETDSYRILGVREAYSIDGEPKGMLGSFKVIDKEGNTFFVGAGRLPHHTRVKYWNQRSQFYVKKLYVLVAHEPYSSSRGVPSCCAVVDVIGVGEEADALE